MGEFPTIIGILRAHGVEFIVIGGYAEMIFGSPRMTSDFNACYRRAPENLRRLAAALKELRATPRDFPAGLPFIIDEATLNLGSNFTFTTPLGDLDLLAHVALLGGYEELLKNAETWTFAGQPGPVISLADLLKVKLHINRLKDQESIVQLRAIAEVRAQETSPPPAAESKS